MDSTNTFLMVGLPAILLVLLAIFAVVETIIEWRKWNKIKKFLEQLDSVSWDASTDDTLKKVMTANKGK